MDTPEKLFNWKSDTIIALVMTLGTLVDSFSHTQILVLGEQTPSPFLPLVYSMGSGGFPVYHL